MPLTREELKFTCDTHGSDDPCVQRDLPCYAFWYNFSFYGLDEEGEECHASTCIGYPDKAITVSRIKDAKKAAGVNDSAVLLTVILLGKMTREEFEA